MKRLRLENSRHARQALLVGSAGQAKLSVAVVSPGGSGVAREVEVAYLTLAGVRVDDGGDPASVELAPLGLRHEAAREVGEGALRALVAMRRVLA